MSVTKNEDKTQQGRLKTFKMTQIYGEVYHVHELKHSNRSTDLIKCQSKNQTGTNTIL